ncbi:hypothetical protein PMG11_06371 [Penicillium brasilianum]|uniref:AB hydrolase-1 domain-containing protein n=1 Tax=Penicillium brasilianum TaxID=104259 RepID=A0A0F7TRN7_PENBI|nr:hypothetical protein PMG11_06371 [Penicillium brasilianum]
MVARSMSSLAASRVRLAYELHRASKSHASTRLAKHTPILFLHGFLGSKRENRQMSRNLATELSRDVYALDLRNHGDSDHHPRHDYMEMALDVESFINYHELERPTLIGHSMGAKTALTLALHTPKLVSNIVAVDNCPIKLPVASDFLKYLESMEKAEQEQVRTHAEADEILREYKLDPPVRLWLLSNFIKQDGSPYLRLRVPLNILRNAMGPLGDFPYDIGNVPAFQGPTLFLRALQSNFIPQSSFPLISKFFPKSEIVDMDCGHWIVQDKPQQFKEEVVRFLQKF